MTMPDAALDRMKRVLTAVIGFAGVATLCAGDFKAGFARMDITPPTGIPLAGYYHRRVSDGVLDPLYARCLAISDGDTHALVFSIDNIHLSNTVYDDVRTAISKKTGVPLEAVFLACTHTHTGPVSRVQKKDASRGAVISSEDADVTQASNMMTAERCAEAGAQALADLTPATVMIGRGEAKGISFVRRYRMKDGTVRTNPGVRNPNIDCPLGEPDEQLQLIRFVREGKPEIALVNFQCHPDTIGGTKISADWPGLSCGYLEAAMSGSVRAIFVNGAQGDTNSTNIKGDIVKKGYERANHMARVVAGAALATWGRCEPVEAGTISAATFRVKATPNKGTEEEIKAAREYVKLHKAGRTSEIPGVGMSRTAVIAKAYRILHTKNMPDTVELPVSIITIGKSIAFCGFPGEPFTWMGTEVKARSPFRMTIPACCVNGSYGYFPVKSAYTNGGYENATTRYTAGTAERLVEAALKELHAVHMPAFAAIKSIEDPVCTISDSVAFSNDIAIVSFVLKPEAECNIRCQIALPPSQKWNGEFWGLGNSSFGGVLPPVYGLSASIGSASATTDLGTSRYITDEGRKQPVPPSVLRDYSWRATHLMTVYGKRIVKAFYGREPHHSYFRGGSCGGRQGFSETMRFPADYDGILASIPAAFSTVGSAQMLNLYKQTHDDNGRALFTREQLLVVADAPIEYMKDRDPKPYAGKVLANPILPERDIDGFLALAAKKDPSLAGPDLIRRLKNIFMGVSRDGKTVCHGMLPGAYFGFKRGRNFEDKGGSLMTLRYRRLGFGKVASWEDYEDEVARTGGLLNACSTDLNAFRDRGGKLMVLCGWEDQTTPSPETLAWYEMLSERYGGYEQTSEFCRLFALPGHAHGGGQGRISTGGGYTVKHLDLLRRWVEKGEAPKVYPQEWKAEKLTIPVPPYPFMCYQDAAGNWKTKRYPKGLLRRPDPSYMPFAAD